MHRIPSAAACFICSLFLLAGVRADDRLAALDVLFELGLPDTREATWVSYFAPGYQSQAWPLRTMSGSAWSIESGTSDTRRIILLQAASLVVKSPGSRPAPVDLAKDVSEFAQQIKSFTRRSRQGPASTFALSSDGRTIGEALLFVAHLHRRNEPRADELLQQLINGSPSPEAALDSGITALAAAKCIELRETWLRGGSNEEYAAALEALSERLSRGWAHREAAGTLIEALRKPNPSGPAEPDDLVAFLQSPEAARMADFLSATPWTLQEADTPGSRLQNAPPVLRKLLDNPQRSLARLLDLCRDRRLCRAPREAFRMMNFQESSSSVVTNATAWAQLERPLEIKEVASMLIAAAVPDDLASNFRFRSEPDPAMVEWANRMQCVSKEQMAWEILRGCDRAYGKFPTTLAFLAKQGGPETLSQLAPVFAEPVIWQYSSSAIFPALEIYSRRFTGDRDAFAAKVERALKEANAAEQRSAAERGSSRTDNGALERSITRARETILKGSK